MVAGQMVMILCHTVTQAYLNQKEALQEKDVVETQWRWMMLSKGLFNSIKTSASAIQYTYYVLIHYMKCMSLLNLLKNIYVFFFLYLNYSFIYYFRLWQPIFTNDGLND